MPWCHSPSFICPPSCTKTVLCLLTPQAQAAAGWIGFSRERSFLGPEENTAEQTARCVWKLQTGARERHKRRRLYHSFPKTSRATPHLLKRVWNLPFVLQGKSLTPPSVSFIESPYKSSSAVSRLLPPCRSFHLKLEGTSSQPMGWRVEGTRS